MRKSEKLSNGNFYPGIERILFCLTNSKVGCLVCMVCILTSSLLWSHPSAEKLLEPTNIAEIQEAALNEDANCQLIMGILSEFGWGLPQDSLMAEEWYHASAHQGNLCAQKRLKSLVFADLHEEINTTQSTLSDWMEPEVIIAKVPIKQNTIYGRKQSLITEQLSRAKPYIYLDELSHARSVSTSNPNIILTSDRPDPADWNERIYSPGTGDWNVGILRTEYEKMER